MTDTTIKWQDKPQQEGWYAILYTWDVKGKIFADTAYWYGNDYLNRNTWDWNGTIFECAGPFSIPDTAKEWADKNKPENY